MSDRQVTADKDNELLGEWLAIAEPTFEFWNNEVDDEYNIL